MYTRNKSKNTIIDVVVKNNCINIKMCACIGACVLHLLLFSNACKGYVLIFQVFMKKIIGHIFYKVLHCGYNLTVSCRCWSV